MRPTKPFTVTRPMWTRGVLSGGGGRDVDFGPGSGRPSHGVGICGRGGGWRGGLGMWGDGGWWLGGRKQVFKEPDAEGGGCGTQVPGKVF